MNRFTLIILVYFLLHSASVFAAKNAANLAKNPPEKLSEEMSKNSSGKILVMGDSLGFGLGVPAEQTWVHLLARQVKQKHKLELVNASVSGESSAGGRQRLPALLNLHKPSLLILELGGNDGMRGKSLKELEDNLQAMISAGKTAGARVLLVGILIPGNYGPRYTREFAGIFPRLASLNNLPFVPFLLDGVALDPTLMQEDRMHPNAKAQTRLLQNVMGVLQPVLDLHFSVRKP